MMENGRPKRKRHRRGKRGGKKHRLQNVPPAPPMDPAVVQAATRTLRQRLSLLTGVKP